ncbi:MAG: 16S rRNA (guanine(527)-N(7))-methyltransferase RsmG [Planctomycetota bacterium]
MQLQHGKGGTGPRGPMPSAERLRTLCREHGIDLTAEQTDLLWKFHRFLREKNRELNMTRLYNFETMVAKHYVDCMLVAQLVDLPSPLLDMGTGAGFPGIPLKIFRPDLHIIMAEGRKKRVTFLQEAIDLLGLSHIEAIAQKINMSFDRKIAGLITRAVEGAPETLKRARSFLPEGGLAIFMKGPKCDDEVAMAGDELAADYDLVEDRSYQIQETPHQRRLLVFRRSASPAPEPAPVFQGPVNEIISSSNRNFIRLKQLFTARGIRKQESALLHGRRVVNEALRDHPDRCRAWISRSDGIPPPEGSPSQVVWYQLDPALFNDLDQFGTGHPLLLIDAPPMPAWTPETEPVPGCTLFVPFQDPENVGSVIRSAAAFGVARVVLLQEAAHPLLPKACRAAGTSLMKVPLWTGPPIADLETGKTVLVALSMSGRNIRDVAFPESFGLLAGLEGGGLPERLRKDDNLYIPMEEGCESLNAAASVSIALYAWRCRR